MATLDDKLKVDINAELQQITTKWQIFPFLVKLFCRSSKHAQSQISVHLKVEF